MKRIRWVGSAIIVLLGLGSVAFFVFASGLVNAQPTTRAFDGWIAVLQPTGKVIPDQLELRIDSASPGAPGAHPAVRYSVLVCGTKPFHGLLLIGGQARLDDATTPPMGKARVKDLADARLDEGDRAFPLGSIQLVAVDIDKSVRCSAMPGGGIGLGTGVAILGRSRAPIQHRAAFLGTPSPRQSLVWPMVGALPGVSSTDFGSFEGGTGLDGSWIIPPTLHKRISGGTLAARASIDVAVPPLSDSSRLTWQDTAAMEPSVRLTNVDEMAADQQKLTAAGIGLGVGGSLLASLLFEWLVTSRDRNVSHGPQGADSGAPTSILEGRADAETGLIATSGGQWSRWALVVGVMVIVVELLRRTRHRKP